MWLPDSFQVPRAVIVAELAGEIPVGTTMATVAFLLNQATTKEQASATVKSFRLSNDAAKIAWRFLGTGKLVTLDGEILSEVSTGFPSNPTSTPTQPSPVSNSDSEKPSALNGYVAETWAKHMPDEPMLTRDQIIEIEGLIREKNQSMEWLDNILIDIRATGKAKNPIAVMLWKFKNESPDKARQNAERHRLHPPPVDNVIRGAMARAKAEIAALPPEEATDKTVKRLNALKERMGGKSQ